MARKRFSRRAVVRRWLKSAAKRAAWRVAGFGPRVAWRIGRAAWRPTVTAGCFIFAGITASHYYAPWYLRYERHALWRVEAAQAAVVDRVARIGGYERPATAEEALNAEEIVERTALREGYSAGFGRAWFRQEGSKGNPRARSPKGAVGLLQIMPATGAAECGLTERELENPELNVACAFAYLRKLRKMNGGNLARALTQYNGGGAALRVLDKCGSDRRCMGGYTESYDYFPSIAMAMAADMRG